MKDNKRNIAIVRESCNAALLLIAAQNSKGTVTYPAIINAEKRPFFEPSVTRRSITANLAGEFTGTFKMGQGFIALRTAYNPELSAPFENYVPLPVIDVAVHGRAQIFKDIEAAQEIQAKKEKEIKRIRNREHERAYIFLSDKTTVTCEQTGITWTAELPTPTRTNLAVLHPLAFFENVQEVLAIYAKSGIYLERELSEQVLAGMLITTLRHHDLFVCKDNVRANAVLAMASKPTLSYALRHCARLTSAKALPGLAMHLQDNEYVDMLLGSAPLSDRQKLAQKSEVLLSNYVRALKGESTEPAKAAGDATLQEKKEKSVKVYSDPAANQQAKIDQRKKDAEHCLARLEEKAKRTNKHNAILWSLWRSNIKMLTFLSDANKNKMINKIQELFGMEKDAQALISSIKGIETNAIEDDLFSFSEQIERDKAEWKQEKSKAKVDFLSMLAPKAKE